MAVDAHTDNLHSQILELLDSIRKGNDLGWTNEGEVERIKEQ